MPTQALDLATIIKAFLTLEEKHFSKGQKWKAVNSLQEEVFELLEMQRDEVAKLRDLVGNAKLEAPLRIVVTSVLDKTVRWLEGTGKKTIIKSSSINYPAFKLKKGCSVYATEGFSEPLLAIETKNGDQLCIMMCDNQPEGMDIVRKVFNIIQAGKKPHPEYVENVEAVIPKVDFDLRPDISFLIGANALKEGNSWAVGEANQRFRFRMNEEGARALVETNMVLLGCCVLRKMKKEKIIIDRPFMGWFMQPDSNFPMAVFFADVDSWKDSGKLEDL